MKQIGQNIIHLCVVDSTNNYTANLLRNGEIVHGSVILADEQTQGRGQRGTTWQSVAGENLTVSFYFELDNFSISQQESINHWVALSIRRALSFWNIEAKVKWPNDLYIDDRKIAGILIENSVQSSLIKSVIAGIGLNVNQLEFGEIKGTSIKKECGEFVPISQFLDQLIHQFNLLIPSFIHQKEALKEEYLKYLWKKDEVVMFDWNGTIYEGVILGTDEFGLLKMQVAEKVHIFNLKEIKFI